MNITFEAAKPRVNWARNINNIEYTVDKTLKNKIETIKPELEAEAKKRKTNITLAQKEELLLVNSGAITTTIEEVKSKSSHDLYNSILDNVYKNEKASKGIELSRLI